MKNLILSVFALSLVLGSCDLTSLNQNEKDPTEVSGDPLFTNAQVSLGKFVHDTNVNLNIFKYMAQYFTATDYPQEPQYQLDNRTIPSEVWTDLYRDVLADLQEAEEKIDAAQFVAEEVKQNKKASIEVLNILTYSMLVNIFGDVPYSEALDPENTQPAYGDAQTIYVDLLDRLDAAIGQFNTSAAGFGGADVYYNGNIESWIKFANSLKLRLAITVADVAELEDRAQTAIEAAAPNAFESNADNAIISFQASSPNSNPVWEALVESGRDDYIPAEPMVDRMNTLNDPRRTVFMDTVAGGVYDGGPYGVQNTYADYSHFSATIEERTRPGMILGYSEVEFILAEAAQRGYSVPAVPGGGATAEDHYEAAIRADLEYWNGVVQNSDFTQAAKDSVGISEQEILDYLAQPEVAYDPGTWKEKIGTQKWLALFLQGLQGWTVFRRLDYPELQAPPDAVESANDQVPVRYTYPINEQRYNNANYQAAAEAIGGDELYTKLFWDVY